MVPPFNSCCGTAFGVGFDSCFGGRRHGKVRRPQVNRLAVHCDCLCSVHMNVVQYNRRLPRCKNPPWAKILYASGRVHHITEAGAEKPVVENVQWCAHFCTSRCIAYLACVNSPLSLALSLFPINVSYRLSYGPFLRSTDLFFFLVVFLSGIL